MRSLMMMAVLAAGSASLLAQNAPVKMGLWEKTIVRSSGDGPPSTMKAQSCITPAAWQRMTANVQKPHDGCKMDTVKTGNGYTFNGTCNLASGSSMVMSGSETIQDSEHVVSESRSSTTMNGNTRTMVMHSTSRFMNSSCGAVKPDETQ